MAPRDTAPRDTAPRDAAASDGAAADIVPGEIIPAEGVIHTRVGAPRVELYVLNTGDRPIQVGSHFHLAQANAEVGLGGRLDLLLKPTIVAARAQHHGLTHAALAADARVRITERIVLGRHDEEPGRWRGTTRVQREGRPVFHTTVDLGPGSAMWRPPTTPRAYATDLVFASELADTGVRSRTGPTALLLPLPGGWVATAWGERLQECAGQHLGSAG